jgi:hypothetical protein
MKIRELIKYLQTFDPELEVRICRQDWHDPVEQRDVFVVKDARGAEFEHLLIN